MTQSYSAQVRTLFNEPRHAGTVEDPAAVRAYVEEGGAGARILLTAVTENARLRSLRFQVLGCPYVLAGAEWVCERFAGQPVESLRGFDAHALLEEFAAPVEKTGRLLLLEDAVHRLYERCTQERS